MEGEARRPARCSLRSPRGRREPRPYSRFALRHAKQLAPSHDAPTVEVAPSAPPKQLTLRTLASRCTLLVTAPAPTRTRQSHTRTKRARAPQSRASSHEHAPSTQAQPARTRKQPALEAAQKALQWPSKNPGTLPAGNPGKRSGALAIASSRADAEPLRVSPRKTPVWASNPYLQKIHRLLRPQVR